MRVTERFHCYPRQRPLCRRLRIRPETADCLMAVAVVAASVIWLGAIFFQFARLAGGAR